MAYRSKQEVQPRKEVVLWNMTVQANEVVLSSDSRRAVQPDSHQLVGITVVTLACHLRQDRM